MKDVLVCLYRQGKVHAYAKNGRRLTGGNFHFDFPSVGATETLMMAACLADGESVLSNVARVCIFMVLRKIPRFKEGTTKEEK